MKALSLLAELSAASDNPSIRDLEGRLDPSQKTRVLEYLRLGTPIFDVMGATPDPLRPGSLVPGGGSLLTDGFWVWRLDLQNYVAAYDLALPEQFLATAMARASGVVRELSEVMLREALATHGWS